MRRIACRSRPDWQQRVEAAGLVWHSNGLPYWNESAFYQFSALELAQLEAATNELEAMTLGAVEHGGLKLSQCISPFSRWQHGNSTRRA